MDHRCSRRGNEQQRGQGGGKEAVSARERARTTVTTVITSGSAIIA
ncbi:MAG: hypothetical protein HC882_04380 [Acidobacteria bacterium]|nr:hypothetical protein [Acidobacteriota bacterium]